ncbi:hypothetical protein [Bradyrhizobium sp. BRP56]|uniref:hypothetical protein n=1 Tax=Bradyrhizobium sp. BRP56 TaxID=2793819 RepID=UPI001CD45F8A|nr:hypothetical protein [Bradyrhizobium sp. BRP56]
MPHSRPSTAATGEIAANASKGSVVRIPASAALIPLVSLIVPSIGATPVMGARSVEAISRIPVNNRPCPPSVRHRRYHRHRMLLPICMRQAIDLAVGRIYISILSITKFGHSTGFQLRYGLSTSLSLAGP